MWKDIEKAPKVIGNPLWCRGNNWGDPKKGIHYTWAYWDGACWRDQMGASNLTHLTEYKEN